MAWLQGLIHGFGALVAGGGGPDDDHTDETSVVYDDCAGDEAVIQLFPDEFMYESPEEANAAFVRVYIEYMSKHYGRVAPTARSDFFCNMYTFSVDTQKFWVLPTLHPIHCVLENNKVPPVSSGKRTLWRGAYETDVVYDEQTIQGCIESVEEWFEASKKGKLGED